MQTQTREPHRRLGWGTDASWAVHALHHTVLTDITAVAQRSWLCLLGLIPSGCNPAGPGLAWPGWAVLDKAGQGRASQGKTADGSRCQSLPERAPESRVTQALPDSDYCSFNRPEIALHPHAPRQPSPTPTRQMCGIHFSLSPNILSAPEGAGIHAALRASEKGLGVSAWAGGSKEMHQGSFRPDPASWAPSAELHGAPEARATRSWVGAQDTVWGDGGFLQHPLSLSEQIGSDFINLVTPSNIHILAQNCYSLMVWDIFMGVHMKHPYWLLAGWPTLCWAWFLGTKGQLGHL